MSETTSRPLPTASRREGVLFRYDDLSGVSGTDVVAEVTQFSSGKVVFGWLGRYPSVVVWDSVDMALAVHGHHGATVIRWADGTEQAGPELPEEDETCNGS